VLGADVGADPMVEVLGGVAGGEDAGDGGAPARVDRDAAVVEPRVC
jgi:hypothetical protein